MLSLASHRSRLLTFHSSRLPSRNQWTLRTSPNVFACKFSTQTRQAYRCTSCGKELPKWVGQCPQCKEWNTLKEAPIISANKDGAKVERERAKWVDNSVAQITRLSDQASSVTNQKIPFADPELSRVFGGGLVLGSVVLLAGTPGVGKS